jgi:hypothetical protein
LCGSRQRPSPVQTVIPAEPCRLPAASLESVRSGQSHTWGE